MTGKTLSAHVDLNTAVLLHHQYKLAQEKIAQNIDQQWLNSLETEDDILRTSVDLTRHV
jgi:hypothetical protein